MPVDYNFFSRLSNAKNSEAYEAVLVDLSLYIADLTTIEWSTLHTKYPTYFSLSSDNAKYLISICYQDVQDLYKLLTGKQDNSEIDRDGVFDVSNFFSKLDSDVPSDEVDKILEEQYEIRKSPNYSTTHYKALIQITQQIIRIILHPSQHIRDQHYISLNFLSKLTQINKNDDIKINELAKMIKKEFNQTEQYYYPSRILNYLPCDYPKWVIHEEKLYKLDANPLIYLRFKDKEYNQGDKLKLEANFIAMTDNSTKVADFALFLIAQSIALNSSQFAFYSGIMNIAKFKSLLEQDVYVEYSTYDNKEYIDFISLIYMFHRQIGQTIDPMDYDINELKLRVKQLPNLTQRTLIKNIYENKNLFKGVNR